MHEFLLHVKALTDALASVGEPIALHRHIGVILEGLADEYSSVILVIQSKLEPLHIEEIETLLRVHKSQLQKFCHGITIN